MRLRRLVLLAVAAVVLAASPVQSQTPAPNPLDGGVWALQFRIDSNFTLSTFSGSVLSVKRHYSPTTALRAGLGVNLDGIDSESQYSDPDTSFVQTNEIDGFGVDLSVQFLHYLRPASRVTFFWGAGPTGSYSTSTTTFTRDDERLEGEADSWSIGVVLNFGVEWFAARDVGIHAEYGIAGTYRSFTRDSTRDVGGSTYEDGTNWTLRGQNVLFGVSVYF